MKITQRFQKSLTQVKKIGSRRWQPVRKQIAAHPLLSFLVSLGVLFLLIVAVNVWGRPMPELEEAEVGVKAVRTYQIGAVPRITLQAKVEKSGVVTVMAQTGGVVNAVRVSEGEVVGKNQVLVNLSSTYAGANTASIQRQIAEANYQNTKENQPLQQDLIAKRREMAEASEESAERQRELSRETLDRTRNALGINEEILDTISDNLESLEALPPSDETAPLILSTRQLLGQYTAGVNSLRDAVGNLEFAGDEEGVPARLTELSKEVTLRGLELEERGLNLALEIAQLNLKLARVGEMLFFPQTPFAGTVERVWVKPGQMVSPGQPLMAIAGTAQSVKAVALVSRDVAEKVSRFDASRLYWEGKVIEQIPQYVSTEPTDGNLYAITWCQLDVFSSSLSDQEYILVDAPIGSADTSGAMPYIPLDAVYQTQDEAFVFIAENGSVVSREVDLGLVYGSYVQVEKGLGSGDQVILDRAVVSGDLVEVM